MGWIHKGKARGEALLFTMDAVWSEARDELRTGRGGAGCTHNLMRPLTLHSEGDGGGEGEGDRPVVPISIVRKQGAVVKPYVASCSSARKYTKNCPRGV